MTNYIDLHTHSTASDGSYTPTQLIDLAEEIGLSAIALTDHDTISGIPEFLEHATKVDGLTAIPGCEISINFSNKEIHIVALFIDYKNEELLELLSEIRENRNKRNDQMIAKLQNLNFDITIDEVLEVASGESVGRPHFADVLISKGYFSERQQVFDAVLKRGRGAYCHRVLPTLERALSTIHNAGGIAIWAHPVYRKKNERSYVRKTLRYMSRYEIDGVETHYPLYSDWQHQMLREVAAELGILESGGSDFHGANQPGIDLGIGKGNLKIPYSIFELQKEAADKRKANLAAITQNQEQ